MNETIYDDLIIGAGLTGLTLAWNLTNQFPERKILLIEKSKSCGGRMATRRLGDLKFDHGAQFLKNNEISKKWIQIWDQAGVIKKFPLDSMDAVCARSGLTQLPKVLTERVQVRYEVKIISLKSSDNLWSLQTENGQQLMAQNVVMTCPLPQSIDILNQSKLNFNSYLLEITYAKALVILVESQKLHSENDIYQEYVGDAIFSICDQTLKSDLMAQAWTVVMSPQWSHDHFDLPDETILFEVAGMIKNKRPDILISAMNLKKWKYSHPLKKAPHLFENPHPGLYLAGDAFGGPSLIGSLRSSHELFENLRLKN